MNYSPLMLGTVQFGLDYGIANKAGKPSFDTVCDVISKAWEGGVNCLDTAAIYGDSEVVVGRALQQLDLRNKMQVVSKVSHLPEDLPSDEIDQYIEKSVLQSLQNLQIESLDVCLFHHEKYFYAIESLQRLKQRGLVRKVGISFTGGDYELATKVLLSPLVDVVQVPGSLLDRRFEETLPMAKMNGYEVAIQHSKTIFVRSVYLQGLLLMSKAPANLAAMQPALEAIAQLAADFGLSREELCVRYMLGIKGVASLLMGVDNAAQLEDNMAIIKKGSLPSEVQNAVTQKIPLLSTRYLCPALWPNDKFAKAIRSTDIAANPGAEKAETQ